MKASLFPDFGRRATDLEIMDDFNCSGQVVFQTLRELEIINRWLGGNKVTLDALRKMLVKVHGQHLTIADLGCGGGDMLKRIADLGRKNGMVMQLTGVDANPHIIEIARKNCEAYPEISFETTNILSIEFSQKQFDIIVGTLFFHHFDDQTLCEVLSRLVKQVRVGLIINDIHRHWLAYSSIRLLTRLFSSSSMVRFDAPLSVRRAFVRMDWITMFDKCGIAHYSLAWKWAFRWKVIIPAQ